PGKYLYTRPKNGGRGVERGLSLIPHRLYFSEIGFHDYELCISINGQANEFIRSFAANLSALDLTSATRRPQPTPKTGQVFSDCRKRKRSSQINLTKCSALVTRAAATTVSVMAVVSPERSSTRRKILPLRTTPEFTP